MKIVLGLISVLVIIFIGAFSYTWYQFRKTTHIHSTLDQEVIKQYPIPHQNVTVTTKDGEKISVWYTPVVGSKTVVILVHGFLERNGGKTLMLPQADYLIKAGYSTALLDLRGAGDSTGNQVYLGTKEWQDVDAVYDYVRLLPENNGKKIGVFGNSMGGATTLIMAGKTEKPDFVIAAVPFAYYDDQFAFEVGKANLPVPLFLPLLKLAAAIELGWNYQQYDPAGLIVNFHKPIFIIAAKNDHTIDYHQGEQVYSVANEPKSYWLTNTDHVIYSENPEEFKNRVLGFLESVNK